MKVSKFLNEELVQYACYSTLRMIGSAIDGQKNVHRKVIYTIVEKMIKNDIKVSQLNSKMAEFSEYLHGDASNAISRMAQEFPGTNNIPLLAREGNFGTRFKNEPSAPRYIYTYGSDALWTLINKNDNAILEQQEFEGNKIEPKFYLPSLPLLVINGSEGMATGFAQKILPRNPKKIYKYINDYLKGSLRPDKSNSLEPYFEGFNGTITQGERPNQWLVSGTFERINSTKIFITEIPVGTELKAYIKVLDKLEEDGVIRNYKDFSEKTFNFEVNFNRGVLDKLSDEKVLQKLKLVKTISETYTAIDETLKVKVFGNVKEIIEYYIDVKMRYMQKRKDYIIEKIQDDIRMDISKYTFIKLIVDDELVISKRKKVDIEKDLNTHEKIIKRDGNYDYLLNMSIGSLTYERMKKLMAVIKSQNSELKKAQKQTLQNMWLEDLEDVKKLSSF
jgi:DNA topoisomerase-2